MASPKADEVLSRGKEIKYQRMQKRSNYRKTTRKLGQTNDAVAIRKCTK
jgi:hypothetical protein